MKALWILVFATTAAPAFGGTLTKPDGWTATDSKELADGAASLTHFGVHDVVGTKIAAMQITPPDPNAGVTLFATRIEMKVANDPAAVRAEIDTFHGAAQRAQLAGSKVVEQGWAEHADDTAKQVEATLGFHDTTNSVTVTSRIVIAATAETLISVSGECMTRDDADPKLVAVCRSALASLDPSGPSGSAGSGPRVAIALAPSGTPAPSDPHPTGPTISDGSHLPIAPITIHPDAQPEVDRRPMFIGAGIVLLAGVLWWNLRRRARDEEDEDQS
ncbi:MAG: hypothetical protein ABI591_16740 [Kofleriaceae bacterium]